MLGMVTDLRWLFENPDTEKSLLAFLVQGTFKTASQEYLYMDDTAMKFSRVILRMAMCSNDSDLIHFSR